MDFYVILERVNKKNQIEIYPEFRVKRSEDLMVRGNSFYAIWDEKKGLWSTDIYDVQRLVDEELYKYKEENKHRLYNPVVCDMLTYSSTGSWETFGRYVKSLSDSYVELDTNLSFANYPKRKDAYISKHLDYVMERGSIEAYDELIGTLYDEENREKIEWCIGAILNGDSKFIQKFAVFYGEAGTGKSTVINIIEMLFKGYYISFDAKSLTSSSNGFATEQFKSNPLVAIQHDGDLSKIEDNSKLNSIVSHELMKINEKYKSAYDARINAFLFMGTNKPVKITDAKSGLIRRLIDINPTGNKVTPERYEILMARIKFELGAIAEHCKNVYESLGKNYYSSYKPLSMMYQTDLFFNFVESEFETFKEQDGISLKAAYELYKTYISDSGSEFRLPMFKFREELKNYFENFDSVTRIDGKQVRSYFSGFITKKFSIEAQKAATKKTGSELITLDYTESLLDKMYENLPAQYANESGNPTFSWNCVKSTLKDIDTKKLHWVNAPENHIVIDFDLKDANGNKSASLNLIEASKWPRTYAEFSKSGGGIHLHYIYEGDPTLLERTYNGNKNIEIKVYSGNASLRRQLSFCNNIPMAVLPAGILKEKEKKAVINNNTYRNEGALRKSIEKALRKEVHSSTKSNIDWINKILDDAYEAEFAYDVTDMRPDITAFAAQSTHQSDTCLRIVKDMKFKSKDDLFIPGNQEAISDKIVFFDVEVFPNLFIICYKKEGEDNKVVQLINPSQEMVSQLFKFKLVGFNNRSYDNHIIYAASLGYTNHELYTLSKRIIEGSTNSKFSEAYNLSYTDVYDFASAGNKQSLKKWEIELGIDHIENEYPWDEPLDESHWQEIADYCSNDVLATEKVFNHLKGDFSARCILAEIAGLTPNHSTNTLTCSILFGKNKSPQGEFCYRDLSKPVTDLDEEVEEFLWEAKPKMMEYWKDKESKLPYFPGYTFDPTISSRNKEENIGKSHYRGFVVGEGGFVYARPGVYGNVALIDVASMHPNSGISECIFGPKYTRKFKGIVDGRVTVKHEDWDHINDVLDGLLANYVPKILNGEYTSKDLANALKTAINSVYGLTSAGFDNAARDPRNIDNLMAKRGALFMIDLKYAVEEQGYTVIHIKTDSIKIADADRYIVEFCLDFAQRYGYEFEHEAAYEKICLVNDAVYNAQYQLPEICEEIYGTIPGDNKKKGGTWTATGTQFQEPHVFSMFSGDELTFKDYCVTKTSKDHLCLDLNIDLPDVSEEEREHSKLISKLKKTDDPEELTRITNRAKELEEIIKEGHNYRFIGKVGSFIPVNGFGGVLYVEKEGKYTSPAGTKSKIKGNNKLFRFVEAGTLKNDEDWYSKVDLSYFDEYCDEAIRSVAGHMMINSGVHTDELKYRLTSYGLSENRLEKMIADKNEYQQRRILCNELSLYIPMDEAKKLFEMYVNGVYDHESKTLLPM